MTSAELENLARTGKLKREPPAARELQGLLASARERLLADMLAAARRVLSAIEELPESGVPG
jgi:hypothetical protein